MASKWIQGITVEIGGDTKKLKDSIETVTSEVTSLNSKLKTLDTALRLDPTNMDLINQKYELLTENVEKTQERLAQLKSIQEQFNQSGGDKNSKSYIELEKQIVVCESTLKKLQDQQMSFNTQLEATRVRAEKMGEAFSKVGDKMQNASLLATGGLVAAAKSAIDFESAWAGVTKTVEGTDEQLAAIREGIFDLSQETASSAEEIAQVAENAGQLGIATDDVLEFTKVMIQLGDSTNLSADEASTALAKFANITKTAGEDYSRLGSAIVALGNSSAATESEIVEMATRLASSGELAGLTEAQILALATALSSVGIEAEAGGSAMSKLIKQIQVAVETGSKDLEDFADVAGVSVKEFSDAFRNDATEALSMFIEGLSDTERNGKSAIAILDDMGITEVRLSNAVLSLAANSDVLNDAIDTANKGWDENVALQNEAEKRYETTESKMVQAKNAIVEMGVSLGELLLPMVTDVANGIKDLANWISSLDPAIQNIIVGTTGFVALSSPVLKFIGNISTGISKLIPFLTSAGNKVDQLIQGSKSLNSTVGSLTSSFGGWSLAIGAIVATGGLLAVWASSVNDSFNENLNAINNEIAAYEELKKSQFDLAEADLDQIGYVQNLKEELDHLVDANGRVKDGYENRAQYILGELNAALGTELEMNEGIIASYDSISDSVSKSIEQKKAKIVLDQQEAAYQQAVQEINDATLKQVELQQKLDADTIALQEAKNTLIEKYGANWKDTSGVISTELYGQYLELSNSVSQTDKELQAQKELVDGYTQDIIGYEQDYMLFMEGTTESYQKIMEGQVNARASTNEEKKLLQAAEVQQVANDLAVLEEMYRTSGDETTKLQIEDKKAQLQEEVDTLAAMIGTVSGSKEEYKKAFNELGLSGIEGLDELLPDFERFGKDASTKVESGFDDDLDLTTSVAQTLNGLMSKVKNSFYNLGVYMAERQNAGYKNAQQINSPSKVYEEFGEFEGEGALKGFVPYIDSITGMVDNANKGLKDSIKRTLSQASVSFNNDPKYNINVQVELDGKDITKNVTQRVTNDQQLRTRLKGGY